VKQKEIVMSAISEFRKNNITAPLFKVFKKILPPLSQTEQEAMESGSVWWDGDLFAGNPDWNKMLSYPTPKLSKDEQSFIDNELRTLMSMLDDYKIVHEDRDLPKPVWDFIKTNGFFALIIPKEYGGRAFSAYANSTIVSTIATRSLSTAVTVMVPNSLGPGELLAHYGTQAEKDRWLPGLANGTEVPCFALTGPEAGSDAGGIPDMGRVVKEEFEGKETLGIRVSWSKRYITLAPVSTVLGLAFKLQDPDALLGDTVDIGITCALIPTSHEGVQIGDRHFPMGLAFMNGTTYGEDVFIPLDWVIGGPSMVGKGWRMLVECLSAGRGISLPALGTACGHLAARMTGAYSYVRKQFGLSIGKFEGVQESLARIGGLTYQLEAARKFTTGALDLGQSPAIVTAISKYHMTEMARTVIDDALDIQAGSGIQCGPKNYLAHAYWGIPVAITVEGANILTRNLMIFGQGATRCHPYVLGELQAAANPNEKEALAQFDELLMKHIAFGAKNFFGALGQGLTGGALNSAPVSGPTRKYYKQLTRMSKALALCADVSMLVLGGDLKRREMISARLGDVLSNLYLASATLKHYEEQGRQVSDLPMLSWAIERNLFEIGKAFTGFFQNFGSKAIASTLKAVVFPFGINYKMPEDEISKAICEVLIKPSEARDRMTHLCYVGDENDANTAIFDMESAFQAMHKVQPIEKKIAIAVSKGTLPRKLATPVVAPMAVEKEVITQAEADELLAADALRFAAINVDSFTPEEFAGIPAVVKSNKVA